MQGCRRAGGEEVLYEDLLIPPGSGVENEKRQEQMVSYRAGVETGGADSEEWGKRLKFALSSYFAFWDDIWVPK